jgi:tetratricopeptide (TPR) repeat protein
VSAAALATWQDVARAHREGRAHASAIEAESALASAGGEASPALLTACGIARLSVGSLVAAAEAASRAIRLDPGYAPAYPVLGLACDRLGGMSDRAVLVWDEFVELRPRSGPGQVFAGESLLDAGLPADARGAWERAVALDRGGRGRWDLALLDLTEEGLPTALESLRTAGLDDRADTALFADAMNRAPDVAPGVLTGVRRCLEDDQLAALAAARQVLDGRPDDPAALSLAGRAMLAFASDSEALATSLRALTIEPGYPPALAVAGVAFARRPGLAAHAAVTLEGLARAMPSSAEAHALLAEALLASGRYREATMAAARAVAAGPSLARPRYVIAFCLLLADRHAEAWWHVRRAGDHEVARRGLLWDLLEKHEAGS